MDPISESLQNYFSKKALNADMSINQDFAPGWHWERTETGRLLTNPNGAPVWVVKDRLFNVAGWRILNAMVCANVSKWKVERTN